MENLKSDGSRSPDYDIRVARSALGTAQAHLGFAKTGDFGGDPGPRKVIEGVEIFLEMCEKDLVLLIQMITRKRVKS